MEVVQAVPDLVIVPPEGAKVELEPMVNALKILKSDEVVTVADEAVVRLLKVRVPLEFTMDEPSLKVIVLAVGAKVIPELTVKAPDTLKSVLY